MESYAPELGPIAFAEVEGMVVTAAGFGELASSEAGDDDCVDVLGGEDDELRDGSAGAGGVDTSLGAFIFTGS